MVPAGRLLTAYSITCWNLAGATGKLASNQTEYYVLHSGSGGCTVENGRLRVLYASILLTLRQRAGSLTRPGPRVVEY